MQPSASATEANNMAPLGAISNFVWDPFVMLRRDACSGSLWARVAFCHSSVTQTAHVRVGAARTRCRAVPFS